MHRENPRRVELRASQLWDAHGRPPGCYGEFYFQAVQEIALADDLSKISTAACLARLRAQRRLGPSPRPPGPQT
jgi:hypothetical protein